MRNGTPPPVAPGGYGGVVWGGDVAADWAGGVADDAGVVVALCTEGAPAGPLDVGA